MFFAWPENRADSRVCAERIVLLVLVSCLREACLGTVWDRIIDCPNMTSAAYSGRKATNQTLKMR